MIEISVIITAYNRKEFLRDALKSLESQTLEKDKFEIILITNFEYNPYEHVKGVYLKHIIMHGSIGEYLYRGVTETKGDIIMFLDDDDLFYPDKLLEVLDVFVADPKLGYYHNNFEMIDKEGMPLKKRFGYARPKRDYLISENEKEKYLFKLSKFSGTFNMSCVSIRRCIISPYLSFLKSIPTSPDGAIYIYIRFTIEFGYLYSTKGS